MINALQMLYNALQMLFPSYTVVLRLPASHHHFSMPYPDCPKARMSPPEKRPQDLEAEVRSCTSTPYQKTRWRIS